jgi:uncharacterized repeat protein (TIGR02543 family)
MLNKEVKVILDLVRRKGNAARSKIVSIVITTLISGLLVSIPIPANAAACDPTSTTASNGETILTFSTVGSCDWEVPAGVVSVRVLVVGAGGGGGGGGNANSAEGGGSGGGGGGAGQVTHSISLAVTPGTSTTISVGAGGAGGAGGMNGNTSWTGYSGENGGSSSAFSITSTGGVGGSGAARLLNATKTDSGTNKCNPAANNTSPYYIDGLPGFGGASGSAKSGGNLASCATKKTIGAGGGGDTGAGANTGTGTAGTGTANSITDSAITYSPGGTGGAAGGTSGVAGANGATKTIAGSGGNGGAGALAGVAGNASAGAKGVVIIRYSTPVACSPTTSSSGADTILTFTATGTCAWTPPANVTTFDLLVVGAGGGGASNLGGGGGGGRVISESNKTISQPATITVGTGGDGGVGNSGNTTNHGKTGGRSALVSGSVNIVSLGGSGGKGRSPATNLNADGSDISSGWTGGGGAYPDVANQAIAVAGEGGSSFIGGDGSYNGGGGGGGAGGPGVARGNGSIPSADASSGGIGISNSITGTATYYGGGGGASWYGGPAGWTGAGGLGGGGQGANGNTSPSGSSGSANTGGGGGAGYVTTGGDGGSGVVIIRYGVPTGFSAVIFNANNGIGAETAYISTANGGTLPSTTSITRAGFVFTGWNTAANGSGTPYALGGAITVSANTTLYAQWSRITSPSCAAGVGKGGIQSGTVASTKAGNGCVGISYFASGVSTTVSFNYTGADQSWTVPSGVTSVTFYLFGAGGGGNNRTSGGNGGYATGGYSVTAGQVYTIIVGEGGGGLASAVVAGLTGKYTKLTYGGGGRGGSTAGDTYIGTFASGGGRSAIRAQGSSSDLATAAGGGGGGYGVCGNGGGGLTGGGAAAGGGTQTAGGASAWLAVSGVAGNGSAYLGGTSNNEGGGGGGGYFGGGDGGDNAGGGGGSSYIALLINGATTSGGSCSGALAETAGIGNIVTYDANSATSGSAPNEAIVPVGKSLTASANTKTLARSNYTFSGWNTAADGSGTSYAVGSTTFTPTGNATLYAQWNSTITYNGNGQTSLTSTVPATTTATRTSASTTLANAGTMLRTGFSFTGWNTQADGLGTNYASGLTTYQSTGNVTLYARWTATITYNTNGASGSPATSSSNSAPRTSDLIVNSLSSIALSNLPTVGTMVKPGFTFGGWNTAALGTGTNYSPSVPQPYMRLVASDFNDTTNAWTDSSGNNRNIAGTATTSTTGNIRGNPTLVDTTGTTLAPANGSTAIFKTVKGGTTDGIVLGNEALAKYTLCHVARYAGDTRDRIFAGITGNWLSGYWNTAPGVAYHEGWITGASVTSDKNWRVICDIGGGPSGLRSNGVDKTTATNNATGLPANITINLQGGRTTASGVSDWEVAEVVIYDGILNQYQIETLENSLKTTYGISGYTSPTTPASAGSFTPTGSTTLYARWLPNAYTISYDTSTVTSGVMVNQWFSAGTTFNLPANAFERPGYTFKNWNTAANGSGTTYTNSQSVTLFASLTLYPQWNLLAPGVPTVAVSAGNTEVTVTPTAAALSGTVGPPTSMLITTFTSGGGSLTAATINRRALASNVATLNTSTAHTFIVGERVIIAGVATAFNGTYTITSVPTTTSFTYATTGQVDVVAVTSTGSATLSRTCSVVSPATSCVITGLTNGTTYQFAATATNATSTSASSTKVNGTPVGALVTYNATANGGTTATTSATYNKPTALVLPIATKADSVFSGWYTTQSSGGQLIGAAGASYTPTTAITLYARFAGIVYTISYNGNGNTGGTVPVNGSYQAGSSSGYNNTQTYEYTGSDQTFIVPNDISGTKEIQVEVWGAGGAGTVYYYGLDYGGGAGGYTKAAISTTTAGETLTIKVGKGGTVETTSSAYGGGGAGGNTSGRLGSSGGGYSGVFAGSTPLAISGGGGGASPGHSAGGIAGGGGGANQNGASSNDSTMSGRGGTTSAGGAKAASCATDGSQYTGGTACGAGAEGGGGGGAGYYGGGGGNSSGQANGGGGGGSGYLDATRGSLITATVGQNGAEASTWAFPNKTSSNYGTANAGRGGKAVTNTTADNAGGNGRVVIQWKTGTGAYTILGSPTKVGYTFAGWNTKADGTGTDYAVSASYSTNANLSLFAKWTPTNRTVTYALDGGNSSADTTQLTGKVVGNTITLPAANTMSKTGFVFGGWSDGTTTYPGGATWTVPASDNNFTLTAQWTTQTLSYSYDTNGGGIAPTGGTKTYGQTLVLDTATALSKVGFTFAGWNDGTTTHVGGASITLSTSKVFVAQWSAQSFSITYDGNGSTSGSVTAGSYVAGGVPYAIAANGFTKTGYSFAGWKDSTNASFTVGAGYSTAANLTLIAQWTASSFTITYNGNGSTGGSPAVASESWTYNPTTPLTLSARGDLVKTGFTFEGWATTANSNSAMATASPTTNTTYYAVWSATQYTVAYAPGTDASGSIASPGNKTLGQTFTLDSGSTLTPPPTITNVSYSFGYWSDGTKTYKRGSTYVMPASNVILTANWIAIYNVTYNPNGGVSSIGSSQKAADDVITIEVAATRTGYNFVKWEDQSLGLWNPGDTTTVTSGRFLFNAQWSPKNNTISFNGNSNTGGSVPANGTYVTDGSAYVIPGNSGSLVRTGYTFIGWNTLADGTGTNYPAGVGSTYSAPADLALFAKWQANTYLISYNGNGATGGSAPNGGTYVTGGSAYTVAANRSGTDAFSKSGFTFAGWNTAANGGGTDKSENATGFTTTTDVVFYAKWTAASFAVTYNTDGGGNAPTQLDTMYGATFTLPVAPTKAGSNFLGWETASNLYAPGSTFTMGSSTLSFIARWSRINYVITYALNGGSGTTPTQGNVPSGDSFTTAVAPSRSGFTFAGWSDGATTTNAETSISNVSSNMTLTAQWTIAAPGIPGTPTVAPGNGTATVTIAAPTTGGTPSSYTVTASPGGATCTVTAPGTSCTIAPLTNGTAYTFTSTATNSAGTSTSASAVSSAVTPAGTPASPTGVTGTGLGGTANISWTLPTSDGGSPITDYVVEYSVAGSDTWTTFADGVSTATSATVTGLIAGNAYEFRVSTKNLIGNSLPSFTSPVVEALPTAPTITGTTAASGQVTVVWSAPTHLGSGTITEYTVTAYDSNGDVAGTCNPDPGQRTCVVSGLDNGFPYTFKVMATTTVGDSVQSSATSSVTPAGVPSTPSEVTAVTSGSNMTVTFTAPSDNGGVPITSYVITSSPSGATCTVGANATTYTCTGLTAGTNYTYAVKAVNSIGQSSESLASTGVTAVAAPSAPQNVSAVITAGTTTLSATVSFDAPLNENGSPVTSYTVTASPGGATCIVTAPTTYCDIPVLPDSLYTFTATATNAVGTSAASITSLSTAAANGIAPTLVVDPIPAPTGELMESKVLSSNVSVTSFNSTPNSVITYQWKRCTDPTNESTCTSISGATSATYALTSNDVDQYIRVEVTATNSIGTITKLSVATEVILATPTAPTTPTTPSIPAPEPSPEAPSCNAACQAVRDAAATKAAADAAAKAAADKLAADAAAKLKADAAATTASTKANADAAAAAAAAKAAVEKAAAAEAAKIAAEAAAASAAAKAKAAADAQTAANKAAATAAAALKNSAASAAAKAAATASAQKAAANAAAAVKAAATAAQQAATAKNSAANANKQVDIAINSLNSKTAASQASAQANAIAAAAKAAANEAAAAAATKASEAKATATAAQKAAADTAARIATEQKEAATASAAAKAAADAAAKATAEKIAATNAAKTASENLLKVLEEKATLAEQAVKTSDENVRAEIAKKLEEIEVKAVEAEKIAEEATAEADDAVAEYEEAIEQATEASEVAETQAAEAVAVKAESVTKTAVATKAAAAATVAAKVATAAKAAAAKVPSKAVITKKPSTTSKNSATATVTGLKPGQKVKVTVNVKGK